MKVAALQMTSGLQVAANLATARRLLEAAAAAGARLAVLPENFAFMGASERDKSALGFPGQAPCRVLARQIDFFAQAFDVQEPEDVPPSLLRLRRHAS